MFLLEIALILFFAKVGGFISKKLKQPAVLGEIIVGIFIGPAVFGFIHPNDTILHMSDIGVILLMFMAGLETDLEEMKKSGKAATMVAIGGVIVPIVLAVIVTHFFDIGLMEGIFIGVISCATSVSISVQTLKEMGHLNTKQGITILSAAIIDDILGIILLTLVIAAIKPAAGGNIFLVIGKIVLFFIIVMAIAFAFLKFIGKHSNILATGDRIITFSLIFCLALAFVAEELGVAAVTGAYFAGVILSQTPYQDKISYQIQNIAYSIFTPIFFVSIGFQVQFAGMSHVLLFGLATVVAAVIGKLIGCGFTAHMNGFSFQEALQIGIGMIPRAEVALIVTNLGLSLGVINQDIFTTVILMVVVTTLITPPLLKASFPKKKSLVLGENLG